MSLQWKFSCRSREGSSASWFNNKGRRSWKGHNLVVLFRISATQILLLRNICVFKKHSVQSGKSATSIRIFFFPFFSSFSPQSLPATHNLIVTIQGTRRVASQILQLPGAVSSSCCVLQPELKPAHSRAVYLSLHLIEVLWLQLPEQSAASSVPGSVLCPPLALIIQKNVLQSFQEATVVHSSDLLLSGCLIEQRLFFIICFAALLKHYRLFAEGYFGSQMHVMLKDELGKT